MMLVFSEVVLWPKEFVKEGTVPFCYQWVIVAWLLDQ